MKKVSFFVVALLVIFMIPIGCKKDSLDDLPLGVEKQISYRTGNTFTTGGTNKEDTVSVATTIGASRANPYTVANFTLAYNELYNPDIISLTATHYYIKFEPTTYTELYLLLNASFEVFDHPLDREIIIFGDFYLQSGLSVDDLVPLYAAVPTSTTLPSVPYTNLASLYLGSTNEDLIRQAFSRLSYDPDIEGYIVAPSTGLGGTGGGSGGEDLEENECGCMVFSDERKPGGCIKVWDTNRMQYEGVRRVKVVLKDGWFDHHIVFTDDRGCFRLNKVYKGKAWMWVHFKDGSRVRLRGNRPGILNNLELSAPLRDPVGTLFGPAFNDIDVKYGMWADAGSSANLYWGAGTVGNALHEYYDLASTANIDAPQDHLDVYLGISTDGFALLSGKDDLLYAFANVIGNLTLFNPIYILLTLQLAILMPEALVGIEFINSDRCKRLAYHEFAHCSHFENVTASYWDDLVWAEIFAGGHGTSSSNDAALIEICEAWAHFVAHEFIHTTYGTSASPTNGWKSFIERTRNENLNHIPAGYFHDIIDSDIDDANACDWDPPAPNLNCGSIVDGVSGFTIQDIFDELNASVDSPSEFTTNFIVNLPTNTQTAINTLFGSY